MVEGVTYGYESLETNFFVEPVRTGLRAFLHVFVIFG